MEIIPAIDLMGGRCVRLTQGDFASKKTYDADPLELAFQFQEAGIRRLHMVDLDGAKAGKPANLPVLENICRQTNLVVDYGGGIKTAQDLADIFQAGAAQVTCGSIAVKKPELFLDWVMEYGSDKIILAADARDGYIAIAGWQEASEWAVADFIDHYTRRGVEWVLCTDISRDGMLQGPATDLYQELITQFPALKLIASGGVSSIADLQALKAAGATAVVFGKALYEGRFSMADLQVFIASN